MCTSCGEPDGEILPRVATPATLPSPERECLSVQRSVVPEVRHSSVEQRVELCVRAEGATTRDLLQRKCVKLTSEA